MNTILRIIPRITISMMTAVLIAAVATATVLAGGPFIRSEGGAGSANLWRYYGIQTKQTLATTNCAGGYCGTLTQAIGGADQTIYGWNLGTTNITNIYHWCAHIAKKIPTAAVRYDVFENNQTHYWYVIVNQANHKGQYVYLGFSDDPNTNDDTKFLVLRNQCQSGYACDGRKIYFDPVKWTTYPDTMGSDCTLD